MARRRDVRPKKPYRASPDQVRITRGPNGPEIEYAEENVSGVHLVMSPGEQAALTDEQILEIHNRCIDAQQASRTPTSGSRWRSLLEPRR